MSEIIKDKNLEKIIKIKLAVEGLNDINEIENISIQDINLAQKKLNINLKEIVKISRLKSLSLKFFEITDDVIETMKKLNFLQDVEFSMCIFNTNNILPDTIKTIKIYNCENFYKFQKIHEQNQNLKIEIDDNNLPIE